VTLLPFYLLLKSNDFTGDPDPEPPLYSRKQYYKASSLFPAILGHFQQPKNMHWSSSEVPNASNNGGRDARGAGNQRTMDIINKNPGPDAAASAGQSSSSPHHFTGHVVTVL
jgi:hypothetical protein